MLLQVKGVVFQSIKFKDNQFIVRIFTEQLGLKSFLIRSGKTPKSNMLPVIQPLNIVEISANFKENQKLITPKSIKLHAVYASIPFDPVKSSVALFLDEILYKTIADDYQNERLFTFLEYALLSFDALESTRNFHLWFLMELTKYYGFYPQINEEETSYFDMMNGETCALRPAHRYYLEGEWKVKWLNLLDKKLPEINTLSLSGAERNYLLQLLVQYIQLHLENAREIKSLDILHEVFKA
ncbi:MAG: DNA repair protein RecO [Flavobacteriales bacterium]